MDTALAAGKHPLADRRPQVVEMEGIDWLEDIPYPFLYSLIFTVHNQLEITTRIIIVSVNGYVRTYL